MEAREVKDLMEAYASIYQQTEEVQQLDEISQKTATTAYGRRVSAEFEGDDAPDRIKKTDELRRRIGKKFGGKAVKDADAHADAETFGRKDARTGKRQERPQPRIEKNRSYRTTKAGKMHGQDQAKLKRDLEYRRSSRNEEVETDLFDYILEHLVAEGYADTNDAALAIMANMSEEWREEILDESRGAELRAKHGDNPSKKLDTRAFRKAMSYDNRDRLATGQTGTEARAQYLGLSGRARSRAKGETPASSAVSPDNESRTVRKRGGRAKGIGAGENRDRPTG